MVRRDRARSGLADRLLFAHALTEQARPGRACVAASMRRLALRARFPAVLTRRGGCDAAVLPPSRQNLKASRSVRPAGGLPPACCAPRRRIGAATQARPGLANQRSTRPPCISSRMPGWPGRPTGRPTPSGRRRPAAGRPAHRRPACRSGLRRAAAAPPPRWRLCRISAGVCTGARSANSPFCRSCMWPSRSVPKAIGTPAALAMAIDSTPRWRTRSSLASMAGDQPSADALVTQRGIGHQRGHQEGALFLHHPGAVLVQQVAVLDAAHARAHRARDGARRIGMRHDVGVGGLGLFADGGQFGQRILRAVDRVGGAGDAAAGHDLDLVGAVAHLLAHRAAHLGVAVGDGAEQAQAGAAADQFLHALRPHVGMAAGLRQRRAAMCSRGPANRPR
jgi:hypothetical protein